ncbi:MAG: ester cyclase, partial [Dermatophilaceae bacterium]
VVASGDRVAVRSTARGTHSGDFLGIAPTGRRVEFAAFDFHQIVGGRFQRSWHLEDNHALLTQLRDPA